MKSYIVFFIIIVFSAGLFVFPSQSSADTSDTINQNLSGLPGTDITVQWVINLLTNWACYFIKFAIIATTGAIIIYGILFLKSRGNPQGMTSGRKALSWGIVGGIVIFGVFTIILSTSYLVGVSYPILNIINCSQLP